MNRGMRAPGASPWLAVLILLGGVSPWSTDMYLSAMPSMTSSLGGSVAEIQLTLTTFLFGLAAGQLLIGPVSDGLGRRPILLVSTSLFTVTSLVCALAPNAWVLIAARIIQGLAGGAGVALSRAVVSDTSTGLRAARRFALLGSIGALAPVLAPLSGTLVMTWGTWRVVFLAITGLGLVMFFGVLLGVPETLPPDARLGTGLTANWARTRRLLSDRRFAWYLVIGCLATGSLLCYVSGSAFVLEHVYGITPTMYSVIFSTNALAIVLSSALFGLLVGRVQVRTLLLAGLILAASGTTVLVSSALITQPPLWLVWLCLISLTGGVGLLMTATVTEGQDAGRESSGTASALIGGSRMFCGALVTPLTGILGSESLIPMAAVMAGLMLGSLVAFGLSTRHGRRLQNRTTAEECADAHR